MDETVGCEPLQSAGTLLIMAFEHYCAGAPALSLHAFVQMCTDIGLVPNAISKSEVHARFRASLLTSALHKSEGLASMLGIVGTERQGEDSAEGLSYAGMLCCLRACAEAAYGAKRTSDATMSNLVSSMFQDAVGPQVRIRKKGRTYP